MGRRRSPWVQMLAWRLEAFAFDALTAVIRCLPLEAASWGAGQLLRRLGPLTRAHRTALAGLKIAYPEMAPAARQRLARDHWENFGRYIGEFPVLDRLTPASGRVEIIHRERLEAIARSGQPAVFISGHFSNLEVTAAAILGAGVECEITYRAANNPLVDRRIRESRARYGARLFAPKGADGARELLTAMGQGRSVAMMNDQKYDGGVEGVFFGRPVRTNPAAARLAWKFGAAIQPLSVTRAGGARFRVTVHEAIQVPRTGDRAADVAAGVAAVNAFIEARVRDHPAEWWWMHRRWPAEVYREVEGD